MKLPRVLVINPVPFNIETGSGITTSNLFRNWPKDKIAQIYSYSIEIDYSICTRYLKVPRENIWNKAKNKISPYLSDFLFVEQFLFSEILKNLSGILKWTYQFSPEIIYSRPHDNPAFYCWLPRWLSKKLEIPYVTHMMDDWPAQLTKKEGLINKNLRTPMIQTNLENLLSNSSINIGISDEMCVAFSKKYNSNFVTFQNCIDVKEWRNEARVARARDNFEFVYMGSVSKEKELQSLVDIKDAILLLRNEGLPIQFSIYGPSCYEDIIHQKLVSGNAIRYMGFVSPEVKGNILADADALVLPVNFDFELFPYMQYSFQTKLPEYMASGTPVLFYGPRKNPNIHYANKHTLGLVVDKPDINLLKKSIKNLYENCELRSILGNRAQQTAIKNHSCEEVCLNFEQLLSNTATDFISN